MHNIKTSKYLFESKSFFAILYRFFLRNKQILIFKSNDQSDLFFESKQEVVNVKEKAFYDLVNLKSIILSIIDTSLPNTNLNLRNSYLQRVLLHLEESYIFLELASRDNPEGRVYLTSRTKWLLSNIRSNYADMNVSIIYPIFSKIYLKTKLIFKIIFLIFRTLFLPILKRNDFLSGLRYVIGDIAPSDHAIADHQKDFLWPIHSKLFHCNETLFILNTRPSKESHEWIRRNNAKALYVGDIEKFLSLKSRVLLIKDYFLILLSSLLNRNDITLICLDWMVKTKKWEYFWRQISPEKYFSSTSTLRNESPQTSVCDLCKVEAINWAYANNELQFVNHCSTTKDLTIRSSVFATHKVLLWDHKVKDLFLKRRISNIPYPSFHEIGPLMFGDHSVVNYSASRALAVLGIDGVFTDKVIISFFEDPIVSTIVERNLLICRPIEENEVIDTFRMLLNLLIKFRNVVLIFKGKKPSFRENYSSDTLISLLSHERCFVAEPSVNQYLPFVASDMVLSLPISSAVDVAEFFGIPGYHYYPTHKQFGTFQGQYLSSIIRDEKNIFDIVESLFRDIEQVRFNKRNKIKDLDIIKKIKNSFNY